jgi:hypothetical protein
LLWHRDEARWLKRESFVGQGNPHRYLLSSGCEATIPFENVRIADAASAAVAAGAVLRRQILDGIIRSEGPPSILSRSKSEASAAVPAYRRRYRIHRTGLVTRGLRRTVVTTVELSQPHFERPAGGCWCSGLTLAVVADLHDENLELSRPRLVIEGLSEVGSSGRLQLASRSRWSGFCDGRPPMTPLHS